MQRAPLSCTQFFNERYQTGRDYRVSLWFFFGTVRLFFEIFFVAKGSPFKFFDILQQTRFSKSRKGPPFTILKTLRFLSLRYSADFRRSRLVESCFRSKAYRTPIVIFWDKLRFRDFSQKQLFLDNLKYVFLSLKRNTDLCCSRNVTVRWWFHESRMNDLVIKWPRLVKSKWNISNAFYYK